MASATTEPAAGVLRVLSLGASVQSSTVLLMSLAGELPRLDAAVFADTGWEPRSVYAQLDRLEAVAAAGGLPVYRVSAGNLRHDALDPHHRFASLPLFVRREDGGRGMIRRQCTREYKITPIRRKVRELYEQAGRPPVEQWLGISINEAHRMRSSDVRYITLRYVLVEQGMSRADCERWLADHGWTDVPKSACIGCPFHSDRRWRELRDRAPEEWADAVAFDYAICAGNVRLGKPALRGRAFLHHSLRPLDQADLKAPPERAGNEDDRGRVRQRVPGGVRRMTPRTGPPPMTFLSLFAGVGGFDLALSRLGMRCAGQVEIDPVCRSILACHFPEVPRHDDVRTTLAWWHAQPQPRPRLDLITAGFPCQDVSTAGRRAGLAGARTRLFFDLARAIDALSPGWVLLENVPGLLSSNQGEDFQVVIATLDELGYGISWRVLDARFFGVAQRRRRVLLVGCRGTVCPFEILFEPQSGHGDLAAGRTAGPGVAATLTAGAGAARRTHPAGRRREHDTNLVVAATLTASYAAGTPGGDGTDTLIVHPPHPGLGPGRDAGPVRGPRPDGHADGSSGGQPATDESDAAASLYTIQGGSGYGGLWMTEGGPSYTLDTGHPHLVALPAPPTPAASPTPDTSEQPPAPVAVRARSFSQNQRGEVLTAEVAASLGTGGGKPGQGYPAVVISTDVHAAVPSAGIRDEPQRASAGQPAPEPPPVPPLLPVVSGTLTGRAGKGPNSTVDDGAIILDLDAPQGRCAVGAGGAHAVLPDADPAAADTTLDGEHVDPAHIGVTVRRLTPRECERLQGFPDGWTALDANRRPVADAARYRAMGNAVAVPVVAWIGQRLLTAAHADAAGGAGSEGDASHPASPPRPAARPGLPAPNFGEVPRA